MTQESAQAVSVLARVSMLRMARAWEEAGKTNQAMDAYLRLVRWHRGTAEADAAVERLLGMATSFEQGGRYHLAMSLYERIEYASRR